MAKLPVSDFTFLSEKEIADWDMSGSTWDLEGTHGYICTVDIHYPSSLARLHNGVFFFCKKSNIFFEHIVIIFIHFFYKRSLKKMNNCFPSLYKQNLSFFGK